MVEADVLRKKVKIFLFANHKKATYDHCIEVGDYAFKMGKQYLENPEKVRIAGYLHDISAIYPNEERVFRARQLKIALFAEEKEFPMIIHQKLSKQMAISDFQISDKEILSAIECHTTLKPDFSQTDLVLFVADKIKWDQPGQPPYLAGLLAAMTTSLEAAAYYYMQYILQHEIKVLHPWLQAAYRELADCLGKTHL